MLDQESKPLVLVEIADNIANITFNRPEVMNAVNTDCLHILIDALRKIAKDKSVRVVIFRGAGGRAFCAGADISEIKTMGPRHAEAYNHNWLEFFNLVEAIPQPVIASVQGWAPGGGTELSLACDFVLCAEDAKFGLSEVNIGVIPGAGATVRLTRWVGRLAAKEILMLGNMISGEEAVSLGLANECAHADKLEELTRTYAERLLSKPPLALAAIKSVINSASEAPAPLAIEAALKEFMLLFASEDQKEGMAAFLEKRRPEFRGK